MLLIKFAFACQKDIRMLIDFFTLTVLTMQKYIETFYYCEFCGCKVIIVILKFYKFFFIKL